MILTNNNLYSGLLTDFYQLTMVQGYFLSNPNQKGIFDMFFRKTPFNSGFVIFAGLETFLDIIENFKFDDDDIKYLKKLKMFKDEFLDYLKDFKFTGDIYSVKEGSVVFPNEPLIRVKSTMSEAQLIETILLNVINFQTLIATKTARIVLSAKGDPILEFGMRRAQGIDGALSASRAAFIGGAVATSNTFAGKIFDIPVRGTMAHSWVMSFENEYEAFKKFSEIYPENCILLIDTFDTLKSGLPNAIKIFKELKKRNINNYGIRLDSGDLTFLSKECRKKLDEEGFSNAKIFASNELDEWVIKHMKEEGAKIDSWGVGTKMITGGQDPALSGVYKLSCKEFNNEMRPTMKLTNNPVKITNPGEKNVMRFYNKSSMAIADLIYLTKSEKHIKSKTSKNETIIFHHPNIEYDKFYLNDYNSYKIMQTKVMENGQIIAKKRNLQEIQNYVKEELKTFDSTYLRLMNPHIYKVSLSTALKNIKFKLIKEAKT
jgi:nicotinate phosphoribosyltransferase